MLAVVVAGMPATLLVTAAIVVAVRSRLGTPLGDAPPCNHTTRASLQPWC